MPIQSFHSALGILMLGSLILIHLEGELALLSLMSVFNQYCLFDFTEQCPTSSFSFHLTTNDFIRQHKAKHLILNVQMLGDF